MTSDYSTVLTRCMAVSALGLATGVIFPLPAVLPFLFGMIPLVWYHLGYLQRFAGEGISQPAVDSVYYYGFLVTIGALGATAIELSIKGLNGDLTKIAFQFGLGLLATGYAVWARMHLTASSRLLDEANLEEAMNKYVARSRELVASVELATSSFESFARSLTDSSAAFASKVEGETKAAIDATTKQFRDGVSSMTKESELALQDLRGLINDSAFGAEREELRRGITGLVKTVSSLTVGMADLNASSVSGAQSVGQFATQLSQVNTHASGAVTNLTELGSSNGIVAKFCDAVRQGTNTIVEFELAAGVASASTTTLSDKTSTASDAMSSLSSSLKKGTTSITNIATGAERFQELSEHLNIASSRLISAADNSVAAGAAFADIRTRLDDLQSTLNDLNDTLVNSATGLTDSMAASANALDGHLQVANKNVAYFAERMGNVQPVSSQGA